MYLFASASGPSVTDVPESVTRTTLADEGGWSPPANNQDPDAWRLFVECVHLCERTLHRFVVGVHLGVLGVPHRQ